MSVVDELVDGAGPELVSSLSEERLAAVRLVLLVHQAMQERKASVWDDLRARLWIARRGAVDDSGLLGALETQMRKLGPIAITNRLLPDVTAVFAGGHLACDAITSKADAALIVTTARVCVADDKDRRAAAKVAAQTLEGLS